MLCFVIKGDSLLYVLLHTLFLDGDFLVFDYITALVSLVYFVTPLVGGSTILVITVEVQDFW